MKPPKNLVLQALLTITIPALMLVYYDARIARPRLRIGVVDIQAVYRQQEAEWTRVMLASRTDAERERVLNSARQFAARLPAALEALPRDCRCLVVLRTAIAGQPPDTIDLTPRLRQTVSRP